MTPTLSDWTIVVIGNWNVAILNPDWLATKIFGSPEIAIEMIVENMRPRINYRHQKVVLFPQVSRVTLGCTEPSRSSLQQAEDALAKILTELPVTPVLAVGINFGFTQQNPQAELLKLFNFGDSKALAANNLVSNSSGFNRELAYDGRSLNLKLGLTGDTVSLGFNYHKQVSNAAEAKEAILNKFVAYGKASYELAKKLYKLDGEFNEN